MRTSTAHSHLKRLRDRMCTIYWCAQNDRPTHVELIQRIQAEIWQDPGLKRCPSWVHSRLLECQDHLSREIYRHLRWYHVGSDGIQYASFTDLPEVDKEMCRQDKLGSAYFWVKRHQTRTRDGNTETLIETITPTLHRFLPS